MKITLAQYNEIQKLQKKYEKDADTLGIEIIKLFKGGNLNTVSVEESSVLLTDITKELLNLQDLPLVHRFKQDGKEFGFIPNLSDITVGEFIDLEALLQQEDLQLEQIMSILYRPVKKKWFNTYSIEDYTADDKYVDIFLKTDFKIILGAVFFFAVLKKSLLNHLDTYTHKSHLNQEKKIL